MDELRVYQLQSVRGLPWCRKIVSEVGGVGVVGSTRDAAGAPVLLVCGSPEGVNALSSRLARFHKPAGGELSAWGSREVLDWRGGAGGGGSFECTLHPSLEAALEGVQVAEDAAQVRALIEELGGAVVSEARVGSVGYLGVRLPDAQAVEMLARCSRVRSIRPAPGVGLRSVLGVGR